MKRFFLTYLLLLSALIGTRATASTPFDSINVRISELEGQEKLDAYTALHGEAQQLDMATELAVLRRYVDEAHRQRNVHEEAYARMSRIQCFANYYEIDSLQAELPSTLHFLEKNGSWKFYYYCRSLYVESLLDVERVESALRESNAIYETATQQQIDLGIAFANMCMAFTYHRLDRSQEAIEYTQKALGQFKSYPEHDDRSLRLYNLLCRLLYRADRVEEGLAESLNFAALVTTSPLANIFDEFYCQLDLALGYGMLGQAAPADSCLVLAEEIVMKIPSLQVNYIDFLMHVNYYTGRYERALVAADSLVMANDSLADHFSQILALESRIKILRGLDRGDASSIGYVRRALDDYERMVPMTDSLRTTTWDAHLNDLHTLYQVDALEAQANLNLLKALIAMGGCVLLLIIICIYIRYSARLRQKNRVLYEQIQEHLHQVEAADKMPTPVREEELTREQILFRKLEQLMKEEKLYIQPNIDRKQLALHLNTNERYLSDAIQAATQLTVAAYINRLRLEHALRLMSDESKTTMHTIAMDAGFTSYDPFLKAFTRMYGMTPSDYRKMLKKNAS
ncbi:helix-turn-helix domain-containing protein [Bacteroides sp. 51]|uniref:helix-turn-helix domain-containing protein n=1 Tax=Bacteroides sp. 51 TaxID=2302938 RepID=UPI0013D1E3F8|nr:helix-turn-helix domain-containing protein [Bacteroides sp. 51]NDV83898.1 AraC family transcriptional regulator [Bacteroides sp. 51]